MTDTHFPIRNVFDGKLFNQRKLKTKTKVHIDVLDEILYADDKDKENGEENQLIGINAWCKRSTWITCDSYDLTINKKDKCCAPIGTRKLYNNPLITANGQTLFNSVLHPFQDYFSSRVNQ